MGPSEGGKGGDSGCKFFAEKGAEYKLPDREGIRGGLRPDFSK